MTLQRITVQPGFKTPLHSNHQPSIAQLEKGNISCETSNGKSLKVRTADSFASPQNTIHYCQNVVNDEVLIFVASAGTKGKGTTIPSK